jgi:hypothetical protein
MSVVLALANIFGDGVLGLYAIQDGPQLTSDVDNAGAIILEQDLDEDQAPTNATPAFPPAPPPPLPAPPPPVVQQAPPVPAPPPVVVQQNPNGIVVQNPVQSPTYVDQNGNPLTPAQVAAMGNPKAGAVPGAVAPIAPSAVNNSNVNGSNVANDQGQLGPGAAAGGGGQVVAPDVNPPNQVPIEHIIAVLGGALFVILLPAVYVTVVGKNKPSEAATPLATAAD